MSQIGRIPGRLVLIQLGIFSAIVALLFFVEIKEGLNGELVKISLTSLLMLLSNSNGYHLKDGQPKDDLQAALPAVPATPIAQTAPVAQVALPASGNKQDNT